MLHYAKNLVARLTNFDRITIIISIHTIVVTYIGSELKTDKIVIFSLFIWIKAKSSNKVFDSGRFEDIDN